MLQRFSGYFSTEVFSLHLQFAEKEKRNIEANISDLKKKGIIERVGPRKNGYWEVRENGI